MAKKYTVELTAEQLRQLGIEVEEESPFKRSLGKEYWHISTTGVLFYYEDTDTSTDKLLLDVANYCHDKDLLQQQAYRETLNRLLWRYSMEHNKANEKDVDTKYYIYSAFKRNICVSQCYNMNYNMPYFYTLKIAEQAIKDIVNPFMAEHPDFKF